MIYFVSDFHFGHTNILKFERSHFATIEDHDKTLLKLWKDNIHDDDIVYFLGDFGNLNDEDAQNFKSLKGKKFMIIGNHDKKSIDYYKDRYGFNDVYKTPIYLHKRIVLSHDPIKVNDDVINIHGHLHNAVLDLPNYINVNVHELQYKFLPIKVAHSKLASIKKCSTKFLEEWYAKYYKFDDGYDPKN